MDATRRHFCVGRADAVHYFVFTDRNVSVAVDRPYLTFIRKVPQGWPRDSDDRYTWFVEVCVLLRDCCGRTRFASDPAWGCSGV